MKTIPPNFVKMGPSAVCVQYLRPVQQCVLQTDQIRKFVKPAVCHVPNGLGHETADSFAGGSFAASTSRSLRRTSAHGPREHCHSCATDCLSLTLTFVPRHACRCRRFAAKNCPMRSVCHRNALRLRRRCSFYYRLQSMDSFSWCF